MHATEAQFNWCKSGGASSALKLLTHTRSVRPAPHNLDVEQALLGAILVDNEALDRVSGFLSPDHFFDPLHGRIYETLATLIYAGKPATPVIVKTFFENAEPIDANMTAPQYLGRLAANATTTMNAAEYGRTICDLSTRRKMIVIGEDMIETAYDTSVGKDLNNDITKVAEQLSRVRVTRSRSASELLQFADEAMFERSAPKLIKHFLGTSSIAALYGPSGSGKTFYALDIAFHIALGLSFRGRRVTQAPILYIVLEGQADFPKREAAAIKKYGHPGKMYAVLKVPVSLGADAAGDTGVTTIIEAIRALEDAAGQPVALFIIDTLARVMSGDNENEAHAISGLLAKVDRIRSATGAAALLIHHPRKNEALGMRGSSSLFAAMDLVIRIEREKDACDRSVFIEKAKDGIEGPFETYTLDRVVLAVDEDGDEITSCVITPAHGNTAKSRRRPGPSTGAGKALLELEHLLIDGNCSISRGHSRIPDGARMFERETFREACKTKGLTATRTPDAEKQAFNRAFRDLESAGWLGCYENSVWLISDIRET